MASKRIRCPLCDRNVRFSSIARKVVRHRRGEVIEELISIPGVPEILTRERYVLTKTVCPTSGMKLGEVLRLKTTVEAFRGAG